MLGHPHHHIRITDSTNARARELAEAGAPQGTVVTADEQSAGRGRRGRAWFAPPGGALLYSALLRPIGDRPLLPLAVPLAVAETAEALAPLRCELKWPNDVWVEGRKLAGVLIEGHRSPPGTGSEAEGAGGRTEASGPAGVDDGWAVIGVGLNVAIAEPDFPAEIREAATSIGHGVTVGAAMARLNERLSDWVEAAPELVLAAFRERDALVGRRVAWAGGAGLAAGVDSLGHLLVDVGSGLPVALGAGEVHLAVG